MTNNPSQHQPDGDGLLLKAVQCPKCLWWSNDPHHDQTCQFRDSAVAAPPKPAPDAVREALEPFANIGLDVLKNRAGWANAVFEGKWCDAYPLKYTDFERAAAVAIALRLAAPVPSPDGARREVEATHQMIRNAAADAALRDPSPAVAAEPETRAFQTSHGTVNLSTAIDAGLAALLDTSPPVKGDREALIRTICPHIRQWADSEEVADFVCEECPAKVKTSQGEGTQLCRINAEKAADAISSLPVQSAPDREQLREAIASAYALTQWHEKLENLEGAMQDGCRDFANRVVKALPVQSDEVITKEAGEAATKRAT